MRRFNLRAMFDPRGRLTSLEFGDFGTAEGDKGPKREAPPRESCLIAWPTDPAMTGAAGIIDILGVQVSPCCRVLAGVSA
jgi:hypothetical protein